MPNTAPQCSQYSHVILNTYQTILLSLILGFFLPNLTLFSASTLPLFSLLAPGPNSMVKLRVFQNILARRVSLKTVGRGTVMVPEGVPVINNISHVPSVIRLSPKYGTFVNFEQKVVFTRKLLNSPPFCCPLEPNNKTRWRSCHLVKATELGPLRIIY